MTNPQSPIPNPSVPPISDIREIRGPQIPLTQARRWAEEILKWLSHFCHRIEIAGSIRRQCPTVNDIDIVCIPKIKEHRDLLNTVVSTENLLHEFLRDYVQERNPGRFQSRTPRWLSGGDLPGKQCILQLPKCQLDLWFADETNFATRLLCRTGSKEHNIWFAERAHAHGYKWESYEGLRRLRNDFTGRSDPPAISPAPVAPTEATLYSTLGLSFIEPQNRELPWLTKYIDSGLQP